MRTTKLRQAPGPSGSRSGGSLRGLKTCASCCWDPQIKSLPGPGKVSANPGGGVRKFHQG